MFGHRSLSEAFAQNDILYDTRNTVVTSTERKLSELKYCMFRIEQYNIPGMLFYKAEYRLYSALYPSPYFLNTSDNQSRFDHETKIKLPLCHY